MAEQLIGGTAPDYSRLMRLPAEMRALPQWCVTPGTAEDKAPRTVSGQPASTTDPATWTDFDAAHRAAEKRGWLVGFILNEADPFTIIDLDVKDATTHPDEPELWTTPDELSKFQSIIGYLNSYTERSRGGLGFHIIVKGSIGKGRRRDGVEVYSQQRFMICTGNVHVDQPVADRQEMLDNMVSQMPKTEVTERALAGDPYPDWALAERASMDDGELGRLFQGDWKGRQYPSQSEADLALIKLLLPKCESPRECLETFLLSELGQRPKARRTGYQVSTIAIAMQHLENDADHVRHGKALADAMGLTAEQAQQTGFFWLVPIHNPAQFRLLLDNDLDQLPALRWLVKGIIPDAGIGAIYGDSGTYKSFLTLDLLANISNGQEWFGRKVRPAPAVYVPFEGQGGVPNRVKAWRLAQAKLRDPNALMIAAPPSDVVSNVAVIMDGINLREKADREKLVATLIERGWAGGVLCIDTLAHASNGIDENSSEMGEMIGIFRDLQLRLGGVILVIHHSGKDPHRGMRGWSGLHAAMDFVIECQRDKSVGDTKAKFVLTKVKDGSDGLSFDFAMQPVVLGFDEDGDGITSLTVVPAQQVERDEGVREGADSRPTKNGIKDISGETAAADDQFIHSWAMRQVTAGNYPSKNSLKGQLPDMKAEYEITQDRVLAAVERLIAASGLVVEPKSPNGNQWLRPIERSPGAGLDAGVR